MSNFIAIRQRARDSQRKSDLRQLQAALELYRSDTGSYPISSGTYSLPVSVISGSGTCPNPGTFTQSSTTYMQTIPCDPMGTSWYNGGNYYYYSSDGSTYELAACIENVNDSDTHDTTSAPSGSLTGCPVGDKYFILYNP